MWIRTVGVIWFENIGHVIMTTTVKIVVGRVMEDESNHVVGRIMEDELNQALLL